MSNEINYRHSATGATLYATIERATDGQIWDAVAGAFEAMATGSWTDYDIAMTETPAGGYRYVATFPAAIAAGRHIVRIHDQAGGSPAITDQTLADGTMDWDGSAEIGRGNVAVAAGGLDSVTMSEPSSASDAHSTLPKALMWLLRRFIGRTTIVGGSTNELKVRNQADATITTQDVSDDGTTQEIGEGA